MLRKPLIAAAVALCSNGTGAAELKVTELGVVETLVDAYTVLLAPSSRRVIPRVANPNRQMMLASSHDPSMVNDRFFIFFVVTAGAMTVALTALAIFTM